MDFVRNSTIVLQMSRMSGEFGDRSSNNNFGDQYSNRVCVIYYFFLCMHKYFSLY